MQENDVRTYKDLEAVKDAVEESQGVLTLQMVDLRDAYGKGKLGKHVLEGITKGLAGLGLGHYPNPKLPNFQHEYVRVYKLGSPIEDVINAVLNISEDNDEFLRQKSAGDDAETLRQVREIVCR